MKKRKKKNRLGSMYAFAAAAAGRVLVRRGGV